MTDQSKAFVALAKDLGSILSTQMIDLNNLQFQSRGSIDVRLLSTNAVLVMTCKQSAYTHEKILKVY